MTAEYRSRPVSRAAFDAWNERRARMSQAERDAEDRRSARKNNIIMTMVGLGLIASYAAVALHG